MQKWQKKTTSALLAVVQQLRLYWPLFLLCLFFGLFYFTSTNFFTSDLGRHLKNGELIVADVAVGAQTQAILTTNYYSYTQGGAEFLNHHWFFGVIVFFLHRLGGFELLTFANAVVHTLAFAFVLFGARLSVTGKQKTASTTVPLLVAIGFLCMPLFTSRTEIRPESLSLLFLSIFYFLLQTKLLLKKRSLLFLLLFLQILWVNTHLFFIFGPLLAGYFFCLSVVQQKPKKETLFLALTTFVLFLSSSINPHGLRALTLPFTIFDSYAYRVAENQSTFFMVSYGSHTQLFSFVIFVSLLTLAVLLATLWYAPKISLRFGVLMLIFGILANKINRMTPFFGVFAIYFWLHVATHFVQSEWFEKYVKIFSQKAKTEHVFYSALHSASLSLVFISTFTLFLWLGIFFPKPESLGTGLMPNTHAAAEFFIDNNLPGPIFNNYDIGGYLAYFIFPQHKLFFDNRPEAYNSEFITGEYLSALQQCDSWEAVVQKYNLQTIFFYRHDQIDGAQKFLIDRVNDPDWVPVYVDAYALIFVKNTPENQELITEFALPQELFVY